MKAPRSGRIRNTKNRHSGHMLLDCVMLEQRNTALAMAECIELQDIIFKTATFSLLNEKMCRITENLLHKSNIFYFTLLAIWLFKCILPVPMNCGEVKIYSMMGIPGLPVCLSGGPWAQSLKTPV